MAFEVLALRHCDGGRRVLAQRLVATINAIPHDGRAEVFLAMGGVFFRRDRQPKTEVVNDISGDATNLFRILQRHYPQFMDTLTDLERAARFLYLQKTAFGGKVMGRTFGVDKQGGARSRASGRCWRPSTSGCRAW